MLSLNVEATGVQVRIVNRAMTRVTTAATGDEIETRSPRTTEMEPAVKVPGVPVLRPVVSKVLKQLPASFRRCTQGIPVSRTLNSLASCHEATLHFYTGTLSSSEKWSPGSREWISGKTEPPLNNISGSWERVGKVTGMLLCMQ